MPGFPPGVLPAPARGKRSPSTRQKRRTARRVVIGRSAAAASTSRTSTDAWTWSDSTSATRTFARYAPGTALPIALPFVLGDPGTDSWAWSDSATEDHAVGQAAADSWAWSDTCTRDAQAFTRTNFYWLGGYYDTWLWSDSASGVTGPIIDVWAWSDSASCTTALTGTVVGATSLSVVSLIGAEVTVDSVIDAYVTRTAVV